MNSEKKVEALKKSGRWFWNSEFVDPHSNPLLNELIDSYSRVLDVLENVETDDLVNSLLGLKIKKSLLIKHLMILLDTSAETLDRIAMYVNNKAITGLSLQDRFIKFKKLGPGFTKNLSNTAIRKADKELLIDLINILCYAAQSNELGKFETLKKCNLGEIAGKPEAFQEHIAYLVLKSSAQIKQLRAVDLGNQAENYVKKQIKKYITCFGVSDNRYDGQQFDIVLENNDNHVIIEIAFQETTNSTIERKARQAQNGLFEKVNDNGDLLIYVADGAGIYKRKNALKAIIENSHLVCNTSEEDMEKLNITLKNYFE